MLKELLQKIVQKAVPSAVAYTTATTPETRGQASAETIMRQYCVHWAAICAGKVSEATSSWPITAYQSRNKAAPRQLPLTHEIYQALQNPNAAYTMPEIIYIVSWYLQFVGTAFVQFREEDGYVLRPLLATRIIPDVDSKGKPRAYKYRPNLETQEIIPADQVILFRQCPTPESVWGTGKAERVLSAIDRYTSYDKAEERFNANFARPDFAVIYRGRYSTQEMQAVTSAWERKFSLRGKSAGAPLITTGDVDIKNLSLSPKDMMWQWGREWSRKEIAAAFGVPLALLDTGDIAYATARAARAQMDAYAVKPLMTLICEALNKQFIQPVFGDSYYVWYDDPRSDEKAEIYNNLVNLVVNGILTKDEARQLLGYDPMSGDDKNQE